MKQKITIYSNTFFFFLSIVATLCNGMQTDYQPISCKNTFEQLSYLDLKETHKEDPVLPIVLVHGLTQNGAAMNDTKGILQKHLPGIQIYTPDLPDKAFDNCAYLIAFLTTYIKNLRLGHCNLVAHSMGGVVSRGVVESGELAPDVRIHSLITLASPHQGVCGIPYAVSEIKRVIKKPILVNPLYEIMYTESMQRHSSIANIWNEPTQHQMHLDYNLFLPFYNNEKNHPDSERNKQNLGTVSKFTCLAAGNDTVLKPLESARWDSYDKTGSKIVPLEELPVYENLGLNDLVAENKLVRITIPGNNHSTIRTDEQTICTYVIPNLTHESQVEDDAGTNVYEN